MGNKGPRGRLKGSTWASQSYLGSYPSRLPQRKEAEKGPSSRAASQPPLLWRAPLLWLSSVTRCCSGLRPLQSVFLGLSFPGRTLFISCPFLLQQSLGSSPSHCSWAVRVPRIPTGRWHADSFQTHQPPTDPQRPSWEQYSHQWVERAGGGCTQFPGPWGPLTEVSQRLPSGTEPTDTRQSSPLIMALMGLSYRVFSHSFTMILPAFTLPKPKSLSGGYFKKDHRLRHALNVMSATLDPTDASPWWLSPLSKDLEGKTMAGPERKFLWKAQPWAPCSPPYLLPLGHSSLSSFSNLILNIYNIIHLPH